MGTKTGISWTDSTWNPIRGCSRVSEGCRFCYAESVAYRFSGEGQPYEGLAVLQNGHASWTGKIDWIDDHWEDPLRWAKPRRIFVNSMSDLFHEQVPDNWIDDVFAVMQHAQARGHIFQILTKRPKRMVEYLCNPDLYLRLMNRVNYVRGRWPKIPVTPFSNPKAFPLKNVWLGTSVENAKEKHRIDVLRKVPAAIRFLSLEPLLGPLGELNLDGILWAITGGESGPHARPMLSSWVDDIRAQCEAAGTVFYHKQNGEFVDAGHEEFGKLPTGEIRALRSDGTEWDLKDMPEDEDADVNTVKRVGRRRAGETLYGKIYHQFPEVGA
jgi:protein gp37